ncbi:MAG TPA: hypothetical protein VE913_18925 [Longimicrobium sp.]|nr:hypothetical protein [Longimicrobium sp.]
MTLAIRSLEVVASHPSGDLTTLELAPPGATLAPRLRVEVAAAGAPRIGAPVTATYALAG